MCRTVALFFLLFAVGTGYAQTDDRGVKKAVADYDVAWNKKDMATVSKLLADSYVYFSSTGEITSRKSTLEFLSSNDYKLTFAERTEIVIHRSDDKVAVVSSRWVGRGTWKTDVINDDQRCGLVLVKEKNMWKLTSEHCTQLRK